jgi:hypothetical protein
MKPLSIHAVLERNKMQVQQNKGKAKNGRLILRKSAKLVWG